MSIPSTPTADTPERAVYIRHRDRMIRESVFEDLRDTLIACQWLAGTTSRPVHDVDTGVVAVVTTTPAQTLRLLNTPVTIVEYFPEANDTQHGAVALNTFAMDVGRQGDSALVELGSSMVETQHIFNMAFYAEEDSTAIALYNDLRDRYRGRIINGDAIALFNYYQEPPTLVSRMEVDLFRFTRDAEHIAPEQVHLYFGELTITDIQG